MVHSMIVQLPITGRWGTDEEMNLRHQLEAVFQSELGALGDVSGGDIGSGNMNIFIEQVPDLDPALQCVKGVLTQHAVLDKAVIQVTTFQNPDDDEPVEERVVWPDNYNGQFRLF